MKRKEYTLREIIDKYLANRSNLGAGMKLVPPPPEVNLTTREAKSDQEKALDWHSVYPVTPRPSVRWVENGYIDEQGMFVYVGDNAKQRLNDEE
jgi:hypothetical protein